MNFSELSLAELVAASDTMFTAAQEDATIATAMAEYGFTAALIEDALDLVDDVQDLDADQQKEYGEQYAATAAANAALAAVEVRWRRHRKLARLAHARKTDPYRALGLAGNVPADDQRMLHGAESFYRLLQKSPAYLPDLRLKEADVTDGLVEAARAALTTQQQETGEAQRATRVRDDVVARLRATAAEFAGVAKIALEDFPQLREKMGLLERS